MAGEAIKELNAGLQVFRDELMRDDLARKRVEVAVLEFNTETRLVQNFVTVEEFQPPTLAATGMTSMGAAIEKALDLIHERKQKYKVNGVTFYRPWIFLITDGGPSDPTEVAEARLKKAQSEKGVVFFAVGVQKANMAFLQKITGEGAKKLEGLNFKDLFVWLSNSMQRVSQAKPGDQTELPKADQWVSVEI
jgi:uncharacterized protein YegL